MSDKEQDSDYQRVSGEDVRISVEPSAGLKRQKTMAEKMVTGNEHAEAGLKAMDDAIEKFRGSDVFNDEQMNKIREEAQLEVVKSIKEMEVLS